MLWSIRSMRGMISIAQWAAVLAACINLRGEQNGSEHSSVNWGKSPAPYLHIRSSSSESCRGTSGCLQGDAHAALCHALQTHNTAQIQIHTPVWPVCHHPVLSGLFRSGRLCWQSEELVSPPAQLSADSSLLWMLWQVKGGRRGFTWDKYKREERGSLNLQFNFALAPFSAAFFPLLF